MRISTRQYYDVAQQSMVRNADSAFNWQRKLASGQKLDRSSEDPAAAGRAVVLATRLARIDYLKSNETFAQGNFSDMDTTLDGMQKQLDVLDEVAVQAGNGTYSDANFQAMQARAAQAREELLRLAKLEDSSGRPLFDNAAEITVEIQTGLDVRVLYPRSTVMGAGASVEASDMMKAADDIVAALANKRRPTAEERVAVSNARDRLTATRTQVGLDTNTATNARQALETIELGVVGERSALMDTDIAQGVTELSRSQTLLEVARSLFARIDTTGLFGLLK